MEDFLNEVAKDENLYPEKTHLELDAQKGGSVTGAGLYANGSKVAIYAQNEEGYFFDGWIGMAW